MSTNNALAKFQTVAMTVVLKANGVSSNEPSISTPEEILHVSDSVRNENK